MGNSTSYKGITIKFSADTTNLGKELKAIDDQAKTINQEIKDINKGLKFDPKNVEMLDQKFKKVGEAIQITEKRLETLKKAQKDAVEAVKNGTAGAEERYKSLQSEITRTENTLAGLKKQAKETSDAVKKELTDSVDKFAGQVKKLSIAVAAVVTALGGITFSAAASADELNTLSKVTGISTEELQKFSYASNLVDVSMSTLQGSLQRLTRNMQGADDESGAAYEAFKALGVEIKDVNGELRNNSDVFYEIIDALGEIDNATQRDAYAMNIFGRSAQELNPLIIAGSQALKSYGEEAKEMGLVFDQATLDRLNQLQDKIDVSKQQFKGMATIIGGELVDSFDKLFDGADGLLKMVQKAKDDGTLREIADGVADTLGTFINIIASAAKFVYNFRNEIAAGVEILIVYKTALGISSIIQAFASSVKYLTGATEAAAAAQEGLNAATAANPYMAIAAAAVIAANAIYGFVKAQYEASAAYGEFFDKVEDNLNQSSEAVKSYNELEKSITNSREAREKTISDIEGEYHGYEKLIDELYELNDSQDSSGSKTERMKKIIDELNKAIPDLNLQLDAETGKLKAQREEIEQLTGKTKEYALAKAAAANVDSIAEDLSAAQLDFNKLDRELEQIKKAREEKARELAKKWGIDESETVTEIASQLRQKAGRKALENDSDADEIKADQEALAKLEAELSVITVKHNSAQDAVSALKEEFDAASERVEEYKDQLSAEAEVEEEAAETTEELSEEIEDQGSAFDDAKSKVSAYKSELTALISELSKVNEGTKYSTTQILDLIDKYPELASAVKMTAEGYQIEAEGIQKLIDKKAELMIANAKEAEEAARQEYTKAGEAYGRAQATSGYLSQYGASNSEEYAAAEELLNEAESKYKSAVSTREAYERIAFEIRNGNIVQGTSGASSSASGNAGDAWKEVAEQEISEAEHLYKMGLITAEEYYKRLESINKRYYENKAEYLEEYNKLQETVYEGLKKQDEEQLSNAKNLIDRINEVKRARESLENAQNQKVEVFSSAAGFHVEENTAAIENASSVLQSKQLELAQLLQQKFGADISLPDMSKLDLSKLLPDLSGLKIPTAESTQKQITINYQAGNIYISGSADQTTVDQIRELINSEAKKFFDEALDNYIDQADRDRQTGG